MRSDPVRYTAVYRTLCFFALPPRRMSLRVFRPKAKTSLTLLVATGLVLLSANLSFAQSRESIGIEAGFGLERTTLDGTIPVSADPLACESFDGGNGRLFRIEGGATFPSLFVENLELYAGLGLSTGSIGMTADPSTPFWTLDPVSGTEVELSRRFDRELSWSSVSADLIILYRFFNTFSIGAGISPGIRFGFASRQTENLTDEEDFIFNDGNRYRTMSGEEPLTLAPMSLDLLGTLGYRFGFTSSIDLRLEARGVYELLPLFRDRDTKAWHVGGMVGFTYHLPASTKEAVPHIVPAPAIPPLDTTERRLPLQLAPPRRRELSAEIDFYSLDEAGNRQERVVLAIDEVIHVERQTGSEGKERWKEERVIPPIVQIDPSYQADAGLKRWEIVLRYNDSVVVRRTSEETGREENQPDWQVIGGEDESTVQQLEASFHVEDSTGGSKTAQAELPITTLRCRRTIVHETGAGGSEKWLHSIPECLDPHGVMTPGTEAVFHEIAANVREGGTIRLLAPAIADTTRNARIIAILRTLVEERGIVEYSIEVAPLDAETKMLQDLSTDYTTAPVRMILTTNP